MRKYFQTLVYIFISVLMIQCQKEVSYIGGPDPVIQTPSPITAALQGNVFDENNQPAAGVSIRVGNKTATTDANGYFRILDAPLDKGASLVTAELPGYFKAYRTWRATSGANHIEVKLIKRNLAGTIDANAGGEVSLANGAKIFLQPSGVVIDASGAVYTGTVNVYAAYIDPTSEDIFRTVPGSFMANDQANNRVLLASYGMMAVELESGSGQKLQVKQGFPAKLTMPIPSSLQASAPANMPLWYVNEQTGIWQEEGSSVKSGNTYVGEVSHFTFWNCDIALSTMPISFTLHTSGGDPLSYTYVRITRVNSPNSGMVHGYTDSLGQGNPLVPAGEPLILTVYDNCQEAVYSQNIGPFNQATNVGVINLPASINNVISVSGIIEDCNGLSISNGYAILSYNNTIRYGAVDANGSFNISFIKCGNGPFDGTLTGVDASGNQQGNSVSINLGSSSNTNIGTYAACGVSTQEYINYTLDGTNYSITDFGIDSLNSWSKPLQGTTIWETYISGVQAGSIWFGLRFNHSSFMAGNYDLVYFGANNFLASNPGNLTVNMTSLPATPLQFYEGSVSGTVLDGNGQTRTISADFRVRRLF